MGRIRVVECFLHRGLKDQKSSSFAVGMFEIKTRPIWHDSHFRAGYVTYPGSIALLRDHPEIEQSRANDEEDEPADNGVQGLQ